MTNNNTTISFNSQDFEKDKSSTRLDRFLTEKMPELSRTKIQKSIKDGLILVNNKIATVHQFLKEGDIINIFQTKEESQSNEDTSQTSDKKPKRNKRIPAVKHYSQKTKEELFNAIEIIEDSEDFLIINKPPGLLVHATEKNETSTLVDWAIAKYPALKKIGEDPKRPAIVHRLDKDVSGLMIIPKTQESFEYFKKLFKLRELTKKYTALVYGEIQREEDTIDLPIGRSRNSKGLFVARPHSQEGDAKNALTKILTLKRFTNYTLLEVQIMTGRTHQIRVHLLSYGHPIVGDPLYSTKIRARFGKRPIDRIFLHASHLSFTDAKGQKFEFNSPLPKVLKEFLTTLKPPVLK